MPRDYKQLFALFKKHGLDKAETVNTFTEGRTESLTALTEGEVHELTISLIKLFGNDMPGGWTPPAGDLQRKKIIGIARDMRWDKQGKLRLMQRIDEFMLTRTKYKKRLNDLTEDELNKVCHIFETQVKKDFYQGLNKI